MPSAARGSCGDTLETGSVAISGLTTAAIVIARVLGLQRCSTVTLFDQNVSPMFAQRHMSGRRQLLRKIAEAVHAVGPLRERGVELQQRALQQTQLRRDLAVAQHLQRTPHERQRPDRSATASPDPTAACPDPRRDPTRFS